MLVELLIIIPCFLLSFYRWWTRNYLYWDNLGIPSVKPSFPYGNIKKIIKVKESIGDFAQGLYNKFPKAKMVGFYAFHKPMLLINDPDLIKDVLTKNFNSFSGPSMTLYESIDPMTALNPFSLSGEKWKLLRGIQTQAHTVSKIKGMVPHMAKSVNNYIKYLMQQSGKEVNVLFTNRKYTTDSVARSAYSSESDSFFNTDNPFIKETTDQLFVNASSNEGVLASFFAPWWSILRRLRIVSKKAEDFFANLYKTLKEHRKSNNVTRNDLVQQLIGLEDKAKMEKQKGLSKTEQAAVMITFFLDGTETAALVLSYILHDIAYHQDVQEKLREEIKSFGKTPEDFDYDKLWSLEYLGMVMSESLRMHPVIGVISRCCVEDCQLGDIKVMKGTKVFIPIGSLHRDPRYHPDPKKYRPERFSKGNRDKINKYTNMPFGEGPKSCIGARFAQTEMKMAIVSLILNFKLTLSSRHSGEITLDESNSFINLPKGDIWLHFQPLS